MNSYLIEGTLSAMETKWSRRGKTYFATFIFETANSEVQTLKKVVAADAVAAEMATGAKGRFYFFKSMGVTGIYGARFADGRQISEYPGDQGRIFAGIAIGWVALNILYITTKDQISLLGLVLTPLGIFGWWWCRRVKGEIEQLWQAGLAEVPVDKPRSIATISAD